VPNVKKIRGLNLPDLPWACSGLSLDSFTLLLTPPPSWCLPGAFHAIFPLAFYGTSHLAYCSFLDFIILLTELQELCMIHLTIILPSNLTLVFQKWHLPLKYFASHQSWEVERMLNSVTLFL
jgi:hypothetical protein